MKKNIAGLFTLIFLMSGTVFAKDLVDPEVVHSQNFFAWKVYQKIREQNPESNHIYAALGTGTLLRLFYDGLRGPVKEDLAKALEVEGIEPEAVYNRNGGLWILSRNTEKEQVNYREPVTFLGNEATAFVEDFLRKAKFYQIIPKSYDLKHPYMPATIQQWAEGTTGKKPFDLTGYFDPDSPVAIFQAFRFEGKWAADFKTDKDRLSFTSQSGEIKEVQSISDSGHFDFYREDRFEAASLPFGTGRYGLFIFKPAENSSLEDFMKTLTPEDLESWLVGFLDRPGKVRIPLFSVESDWDLRAGLKAVGLERLFTYGPDFSQVFTNAGGKNFLGSFEQRAFFEAGSESAETLKPVPEDPDASAKREFISFTADRPFFFLIRDNKTRIWLAFGAVTHFE